MGIDIKFSIGVFLGLLIAVLWYEAQKRKMG
jgi:hypothetical protein